MRISAILLVIYLVINSCKENSNATTPSNVDTSMIAINHPNSSNTDTVIITTMTAVLTDPDSLQIEKRKKEVGEDNFYIGADDYMYYMNLTHEYLDSIKVKTLVVKGTRLIKFVSNDRSYQLIKTDTLPELWNVFLFDPNKKPKKIDIIEFDQECKKYYQQD